MTQNLNTSLHQGNASPLDHTPGTALTGGDPVNPGGGILGYAERDIAANAQGAITLDGLRRYQKDGTSGPVFSVGDAIVWDDSAGLAVVLALDHDGSADLPVAVCVKAAATGDDFVVGMPIQAVDRYAAIRPFVFEFDCATGGGDTDEHVLIPAWMNMHGLVIKQCYGIVSEVMAGSSEDQGVVTVEDGSDNVLSVITAADSTADIVGDVLVGTNGVWGISSGAAIKSVAAGVAVQAFVSQQTAGTPAGKIKVYLDVQPLL